MTIYCISGLGADYRVFQKLVFPSDYHVVHVEWIQPEIRETLSSYALRLLKQIDNSKPFILIGLSFGGCFRAFKIYATSKNNHYFKCYY
jgi:pimeloyl-ACP methyl ester carboxylesterase